MNFISFEFVVFLAVVVPLYRLCPVRFRNIFLLLVSYAFYYTWNNWMVIAIATATVFTFLLAQAIEVSDYNRRRVVLVTTAVSLLVLFLAFFKVASAQAPGSIVIPIGISYYTFRLISYLLDVYWGKYPAERSFISFASYVAFFPQVVAGPIQRADSFLQQAHSVRDASLEEMASGIRRICFGLFKKLLVADQLRLLVNTGFGHALHVSGEARILAFYLFPLELLADFSGLTDIANGVAMLFGIRGPENFDAPFSAANISDFWRRWHMTLTNWLRDYVFTPLRMGTRGWGNLGLAFSLTVNMILVGLWHGLTVGYLVFGLVHAVYMMADAFSMRLRKSLYKKQPAAGTLASFLGPIVTYHQVAVANVFFRAPSVVDAVYLIGHLFSNVSETAGRLVLRARTSGWAIWVPVASYALLEAVEYAGRKELSARVVTAAPEWGRRAVYAVSAILLMCALWLVMDQQGAEFVYAKF